MQSKIPKPWCDFITENRPKAMYYYQNINVPVGDKLQERKKNLEQKVLLRFYSDIKALL